MKFKSILIAFIAAASAITASAEKSYYVKLPELIRMPDGRILALTSDFSRRNLSFDNNLAWVDLYTHINSPEIKLRYTIPSIAGNNRQLEAYLAKHPSARIVVRVPDQCKDAKFVNVIETKLSKLGFTVMNREPAEGVRDMRQIGKATGADLLLDVSWLSFSDPEMTGRLDENFVEIDDHDFDLKIDYRLYSFENQDKYEKALKKLHKKKYVSDNDYSKFRLSSWQDKAEYEYALGKAEFDKARYLADVKEHILNDESINTNNNVVSAIFKFYNLKDGAMIGFFQEGVSDIEDIRIPSTWMSLDAGELCFGIGNLSDQSAHYYSIYPVGTKVGSGRTVQWHAPWFEKDYRKNSDNKFLSMTMTYISCIANTGVFPYAKELNDFRDVKLTDETVTENSSSRSTTNSSYSGAGATYYHRYFNNSRWGGAGRSNTNSSSSSTTTFKEAEWLHPSDFYGYYAPLTDKLVKSLGALMR